MADEKDRTTIGADGPLIIVKGGTTSSRYDAERERRKHAAEVGRAHQEKQMVAAAGGDQMTTEGFVSAHLHSLRLLDDGAPRLVFYYLNRDGSVWQTAVCEIVRPPGGGDGDEFFLFPCPRCVERGESHGDSQCLVQKSHRYWELDTRKLGKIVELIDIDGKPFHVRLAGTVSCQDTIRCNNYNCTYAVRIEDSKVVEV